MRTFGERIADWREFVFICAEEWKVAADCCGHTHKRERGASLAEPLFNERRILLTTVPRQCAQNIAFISPLSASREYRSAAYYLYWHFCIKKGEFYYSRAPFNLEVCNLLLRLVVRDAYFLYFTNKQVQRYFNRICCC